MAVSARDRVDDDLKLSLALTHQLARRSYGSRRHAAEFQAAGRAIGRYRVRRLMREAGITAKQRRPYKVTTVSDHEFPVAENFLDRQFYPNRPDEVWVGDLTYLPTSEGWLYLVVIIDCFSRKVVGWSMSSRPKL